MRKYQFSADLEIVGRWAFQPPGFWRSATYFVWVIAGDDGPEGVFTVTHQAYRDKVLDQKRTEELFLAGTLHSDIEASIVLNGYNFPVKLSLDAQSLIIGLNGYGIYRALDVGKAPTEGVARDALCTDDLLNEELKTQVVDPARVYPKPYLQEPPQAGYERRQE